MNANDRASTKAVVHIYFRGTGNKCGCAESEPDSMSAATKLVDLRATGFANIPTERNAPPTKTTAPPKERERVVG